MGFNQNSPRAEYIASSGQVEFPYAFKVFKTSDIKVYLTPSGQLANDTNDILILGNDYNVIINEDEGGTVTLLSGAALNDRITLLRDLPVDREVEYQTNGDLLASTLNQDQNYQTYLMGDVQQKLDRFIRLPNSVQELDLQLPAPTPSTYLRWNAAGTNLENDITAPTWVQEVQDDRDAVQILHDNVVAKEALVNPHYTAIDGVYANETNINAVNANKTNIDAVAGINTNVTTVAGISENVTAVANNNIDVTTVASNILDVSTVAGISSAVSGVSTISANVVSVDSNSANINTVSSSIANVNAVGTDIAAVVAVNADLTNVDVVSANISDVSTVGANIANVNATGASIDNVNTVATNIASVITAGTNIADIQTVATEVQKVIDVANDLNETVSEINTVAVNIDNVNAVGLSIDSINNVNNNLTSINNFGETYFVSATAPSAPTAGDLWFDTSVSIMKVYSGTSWQNAGSSVNGTSARFEFVATSGQTTFVTTGYDSGYADVYQNGIKLIRTTDFDDSDGTNIVLTVGAALDDEISIVAYGTFALADHYNKSTVDSLLAAKADITYVDTEIANIDLSPYATTTYVDNGLATKSDTTHNHDGVYEPADATILKDADIGSTVQATLVSGTNIKTINSTSLLGSGDIPISSYSNADALSLFNASGSAPVYACRAWVNFNGTGTVAIRASGNVSSITDRGTGDYSVNFSTSMPDINYSVAGIVNRDGSNWGASVHLNTAAAAPTVSSARICRLQGNYGTTNVDAAYMLVQIFR